jgi:glycosyltransferase involved in cell wall biosynthesis
MTDNASMKILHVLRAPVGGLFRHVLDLAQGQAGRGHRVGIVCAEVPPGSLADTRLKALAGQLALGVSQIPMRRQVGLGDASAVRHVTRVAARVQPDVLHGHGAKGGAFARLASAVAARVYTPHGGSLHYPRWSPQGVIYRAAERILMYRTNLLLFESNFARQTYESAIGIPRCPVRVVHNGVGCGEFETVQPAATATDIVAIGELRHIKGVDVLIEAIATLAAAGRTITATIVGDGPDAEAFRDLVSQRGLSGAVTFAGYQPAQQAFASGRLLVIASRAESLPYIVLEAAAAGVPMVATRVGGIPEIFEDTGQLVPPGDAPALAAAVAASLDDRAAALDRAQRLRQRVQSHFSQDAMVDGILEGYREAIGTKFHRSR